MALNLNDNSVDIVIFGDSNLVYVGSLVFGTGNIVNVPICAQLLGRIVDGIEQSVDGKGRIKVSKLNYSIVDVKAPGIIPRQSVSQPLLIGIKAIDSTISIDREQRGLIIRDRQTGKSNLLSFRQWNNIIYLRCNKAEKIKCGAFTSSFTKRMDAGVQLVDFFLLRFS